MPAQAPGAGLPCAPFTFRVSPTGIPGLSCAVPRERPPIRMQAYVYKSLRKADTYLYLSARDDFARVPESVRAPLGNLQFDLEVALTPERKLARADAAVVRENLATRGFHLQLPPTVEDPMTEDWGTDA